MARTAIILTTYGRPKLVHDAIRSVLEQHDKDRRLFIMDDGCDQETRLAIDAAIGAADACVVGADEELAEAPAPIVWWQGKDRSLVERKATIPYSCTINVALNRLLTDERYIAYICDDDYFYPESVGHRADYLDAHPDIHVVYGRSRSIQYGVDGSFNTWGPSGPPVTGRNFPRPNGYRTVCTPSKGPRCYFTDPAERDLATGLDYVEEAYWNAGRLTYGTGGATDHNQVMHRRGCLTACRMWPDGALLGGTQYWGEDLQHSVGDAAFFRLLGEVHPFIGVDVWTVTKRFHVCNDDPRNMAERRE